MGSPRELKPHLFRVRGADRVSRAPWGARASGNSFLVAFAGSLGHRGLHGDPARVETSTTSKMRTDRFIIAGSMGSPREVKHCTMRSQPIAKLSRARWGARAS